MYALELLNQEICVTVMAEDSLKRRVLAQSIYASPHLMRHDCENRKMIAQAMQTELRRRPFWVFIFFYLALTSAAPFLF